MRFAEVRDGIYRLSARKKRHFEAKSPLNSMFSLTAMAELPIIARLFRRVHPKCGYRSI